MILSGVNRQPPRQQPPRQPQSTANQIEIIRQLNVLVKQGILEKSTAAYYGQGFLVKKADGSKRFVIDYRNLNEVTENISWPVPNITEMLQRTDFWYYGFCTGLASSTVDIVC